MSRSWINAVRNHLHFAMGAAALAIILLGPAPLHAQDESIVTPPVATPDASRPDVIDILVKPATQPIDPLSEEQCRRDQEAASISREIVVCAPARDDSEFRTTSDNQKRYAEETAFANDPQAPEVFGIPNHGPVVARGCFIPPCPPPKAIIIDVKALPEAPAGSDADRIGRGLPPIGNDDGSARPIEAITPRDLPVLPGPQIDYASPVLEEVVAAKPGNAENTNLDPQG